MDCDNFLVVCLIIKICPLWQGGPSWGGGGAAIYVKAERSWRVGVLEGGGITLKETLALQRGVYST